MAYRYSVLVVFICLAVVFLSSQLVIAEDNSDDAATDASVNVSTSMEVGLMHVPYGARVRLLELEYKIRARVLHAQAVVDVLKEKNSSVNITILEDTIKSLNTLAGEAHSAALSASINITRNDSVQNFVRIKAEAHELLKLFRKEVKGELTR